MEKILFEHIAGGSTESVAPEAGGYSALSITGYGYAEALTTLGAAGGGLLAFYQDSTGVQPGIPTFGIGLGTLELVSAYSYGAGAYAPAEGEGMLRLTAYGDASVDVGMGVLPILGSALSTTEDDVEEPPIFTPGTAYEITIGSTVTMADALPGAGLVYRLLSNARLSDRFALLATLQGTLASSFVARSMFFNIYEAHLEDGFLVDDDISATAAIVALLADQVVVADQAVPYVNALVLVASALTLADRVVAGLDARLTADVLFTDETESLVAALVEMASSFSILDESTASLLLFAVVDDSFEVGDSPSALVAALVEILDGFSVGVRLRTDAGDEYAGYALNVPTAAITEYSNYPYNALAVVGGRLFGTGPRGLYRLDGDTDDGAPIHARLRTGLTDFGTTQLKRVPNAYVGYTADGQLLLKVITTDKGAKKENVYRLKPRPSSEPGENRYDISKGLVGMYWGFEFENVDGADFELDVVKIWPMVLNRRYSGR